MNEDKTLAEVMEYIAGTYSEHYGDQKFQIQDVFEQMDIAEEFVRGAAIKYLYRFGKKNGKDRKDLLKVHALCNVYYITIHLKPEGQNK